MGLNVTDPNCCCEGCSCSLLIDDFEREEVGENWEGGSYTIDSGDLVGSGLIYWKPELCGPNHKGQAALILPGDGCTGRVIICYDPTTGDGIYAEVHTDSGVDEGSYFAIGTILGGVCKRCNFYQGDGSSLKADWEYPVRFGLEICARSADEDVVTAGYVAAIASHDSSGVTSSRELAIYEDARTGGLHVALEGSGGSIRFETVEITNTGTSPEESPVDPCAPCTIPGVDPCSSVVTGCGVTAEANANVSGDFEAGLTVTTLAPSGSATIIFRVEEHTTLNITVSGTEIGCGGQLQVFLRHLCQGQCDPPVATDGPCDLGLLGDEWLNVIVPFDEECDCGEGAESAGDSVNICPGWYEIEIAGSSGVCNFIENEDCEPDADCDEGTWTVQLNGAGITMGDDCDPTLDRWVC